MTALVNPKFASKAKLLLNLAYDLGLLGKELTPELIEACNNFDLVPDEKDGNPIRTSYEFGLLRRKHLHALFTTPASTAARAASSAHASPSSTIHTP